jgi:hypothetical protein
MCDAMNKTPYANSLSECNDVSGFSLMETLIAVGLLGLVAAGWMRMMKTTSELQSEAQKRQKVVAIEHYLQGFADCDKTKAQASYATACNSGSAINLLDKFGNVVIPHTGRSFANPTGNGGQIQVTNSCQNGSTTFTATIAGSPAKTVTLFDGIPWYCPSNNCANKLPRTRLAASGAVEYLDSDFKPGLVGQPSAEDGMDWPNGGSKKPFGAGATVFDTGLCPQVGFMEQGHSLTRTIIFTTPTSDTNFIMTAHRARRKVESFGVNVRFWFDKRVTSFSTGNSIDAPISYSTGAYYVDFNKHLDYKIACNYAKATNSFSCNITTSPLTTYNCSLYQSACTNY